MPSFYTSAIKDGITFDDFVWRCARGMGALVMMRDEPSDAPIPERFEPTDHHANKLAEARSTLAWLQQMPHAEVCREADIANACKAAEHHSAICRNVELRKSYDSMLEQVIAWVPPTPDHEGLKDLMVEQINESIRFDCYNRPALVPVAQTVAEWRAEQITQQERDIAYHAKEHASEVSRVEARNQWLAALRGSLKAGA